MGYQRILMESTILKEARAKLSMTQQQVADKARIQLRQYQRFENGERNLSSSSFGIACAVLDALQLDISAYAHGGYVLSESIKQCNDVSANLICTGLRTEEDKTKQKEVQRNG